MKLNNYIYEKPLDSFYDNMNVDNNVNKIVYSKIRQNVIINKRLIIQEIHLSLKRNYKYNERSSS